MTKKKNKIERAECICNANEVPTLKFSPIDIHLANEFNGHLFLCSIRNMNILRYLCDSKKNEYTNIYIVNNSSLGLATEQSNNGKVETRKMERGNHTYTQLRLT